MKEIRELIDYLNERTKEYDNGKPTISDKEWDEKYYKLIELENKYHIYYFDSPSQNIIYSKDLLDNSFPKVVHSHPMLSLDKTKDIKDIVNKFGKSQTIAMLKLDGISCSLTYENGKLVSAETRGDGHTGDQIIKNLRYSTSIPKTIKEKNKIIIDGELICTYEDFDSIKDEEFKNPRNYVAGSVRLLDTDEFKKRKLTFVAWDLIGEKYDKEFVTLPSKLNYIKDLGFIIVPYIVLNENKSLIEEHIKLLTEDKKYPTDGIVFKYSSCEEYNKQGATTHHFKGGLALKFYDETVKTKLKDIIWDISRYGTCTPVAVFNPIEIEGTTVTKANLSNLNILEETLGIPYIGQNIYVSKRNQIIPKIEWAEKDIAPAAPIEIIKICPKCGEELIINKDSVRCINPDCSGKLVNSLDYFCGTKGLDIKGLSKETIQKLIEYGWLENKEDIFKLHLHYEEWINKSGFGASSVSKIIENINKVKDNCELWRIISACEISFIGPTMAKKLAEEYKTWDNFMKAIEEKDIYSLYGFGAVRLNAIVDYDFTEIQHIIDEYHFNILEVEDNSDNSLKGKTFVITGKLSKNRDLIKKDIEQRGGRVTGSISKKTDYLVCNDTNNKTKKILDAEKLGIIVINEEKLLKLF